MRATSMTTLAKTFTTCFVIATALLQMTDPVLAQAFDPRQLEELRGQLDRRGVSTSRRSAIDESREAEQQRRQQQRGFEERGEEQQFLLTEEVEEASVIEMDFRERLGDEELIQFGYDIFKTHDIQEKPVTGRIADSYILGVGDEIIAVFKGSEESQETAKVDSEGRLIIGKLPPINAAGRRFGDLRAEVQERTEQTLLGTEVFLSVGAVKLISVQVIGEVELPGSYVLDGLSDALDAIIAAGGVKKSGSLRNIRVLREGGFRSIDMYSVLAGQGFSDLSLQPGDRIVIPPISNAVAVAGDVLRPAIYEIADNQTVTLNDLLAIAGGTIRPRGYSLTLNRFDEEGFERYSTPEDKSLKLKAADAVLVASRGGAARGRIRVNGHVVSPGLRALDKAETVGNLISDRANIKPGAYLPFAVLDRLDPFTGSRQMHSVNLLAVRSGNDILFQDDDVLHVFDRADIDFLSTNDVRQVVLGQENPMPTCESLSALEALVPTVQASRFAGTVTSIYLVEEKGQVQAAEVGGFRAEGSTSFDQDAAEAQVVRLTEQQLKEEAGVVQACPLIFEDDPELLSFALEHVVSLSGAIRRPGILPIAETISLRDLILFSGGFSRDADGAVAEVTSFIEEEGVQRTVRDTYDQNDNDFSSVRIASGSSIRIQSATDDQELGAVLLTGEFARPGSYNIRKGETLGELIERAGGATTQAYPYGAVFTRRSVKEAQQEGFNRTARELNAALAIAALKKNVDAEAVIAAQELSTKISSTEAAGRVVVEADPRVLLLRNDLNIVLEPGDTLFMPKRPGHVLMIGDVLNPGALQFVKGKDVSNYLSEAGGLQASADDDRIFLVYPNGVAKPVRVSAWRSSSVLVPPGSTIVVPKDTDPLAALDLTRDITTIVSQLAISAASLAVIFDRN